MPLSFAFPALSQRSVSSSLPTLSERSGNFNSDISPRKVRSILELSSLANHKDRTQAAGFLLTFHQVSDWALTKYFPC